MPLLQLRPSVDHRTKNDCLVSARIHPQGILFKHGYESVYLVHMLMQCLHFVVAGRLADWLCVGQVSVLTQDVDAETQQTTCTTGVLQKETAIGRWASKLWTLQPFR